MKITKVEIQNYRNLSGLTIHFDEDCNFIVGENNIGKSNLLWLLNSVFASRSFNAEDFKDQSQSIEVGFQLKLDDIEIGNFENYFSQEDQRLINITAKQETIDDNIEFFHKETNAPILASKIRYINFIHYDSLRNPITEINFDKGRGVGKFLKNIITRYLQENDLSETEFIEKEKFESAINTVNGKISKIKTFKDNNISAFLDDDFISLLSKLIILKDAKGDNLTKSGYGIQFLILVTLSVLEKIQYIKQQRRDKAIFESETSEKAISLVLGLDEPEIHLHPYMQRSLIKYLKAVINNENEDFKQLIKDLFDIDKFIGQIIVVTHSPNIILDEYSQIIRFHIQKSQLQIKCGSQFDKLNSDKNMRKHLNLHFPFIKEAFFSRCAIFVEGDTEYASFPILGEKIYEDFDDLGISVIQARGESVPILMEIVDLFGIPSVGITDKNKGDSLPIFPQHYQTTLRDFEEEIVSFLLMGGDESTLREIVMNFDSQGDQRIMMVNALNKQAKKKYNLSAIDYTNDLKLADIPSTDLTNLKAYYLSWFSTTGIKSFPLGKLIGETLTEKQVPIIYKTVFAKARELAKNAQ